MILLQFCYALSQIIAPVKNVFSTIEINVYVLVCIPVGPVRRFHSKRISSKGWMSLVATTHLVLAFHITLKMKIRTSFLGTIQRGAYL